MLRFLVRLYFESIRQEGVQRKRIDKNDRVKDFL